MIEMEEEYGIYFVDPETSAEIRKYFGHQNQIPKDVLEKVAW